ncbi:unnamed protein product [Lupinus luteus]|uniref:Uncharacterized protein n=1 Tax=Lupinus luteus TaxID=3873 RepID=A0AAV1WVB8_LUPLU
MPLIILCYSTIAIIFQHVSSASLPNNETVPAVIVFGDSIVDPGNNNYIETLIKCNFPPYGRDFVGGNNPTGRFSNGLVPSDIIDQLDMFKEYIMKIKEAFDRNIATTIVSKSIYIVCIGSDDIANTYAQTPFRRAQYDIQSYTDFMASEASKFLQELYGIGARRIGVFSIPVIGCVPSQRTIGGGILRSCSDSSNQGAILFNSKLSSQMVTLQTKLPDARFVYLDSYTPFLDMLQNPTKYGFEETDKGCCGTGNIEVGILCNRYSIDTCSNSSNYLFWDSYHPTEKTYNVLSSLVLDNKINDFF